MCIWGLGFMVVHNGTQVGIRYSRNRRDELIEGAGKSTEQQVRQGERLIVVAGRKTRKNVEMENANNVKKALCGLTVSIWILVCGVRTRTGIDYFLVTYD